MTASDVAAARGGPDVVRPFAGMLVSPDWAEQVVSPMLDAVPPAQRAALVAEREYAWLNVTAGAVTTELPPDRPGGSDALRRLLDRGAFTHTEPGVFVYRIVDARGSHAGLVVDVAAAAFVDGRVRGHEAVQPGRVDALVRHLSKVHARSELVALLRAPDREVDEVVERACAAPPILDFGSGDARQTVWRVAADDTARVTPRLASHPLYVADGHHRVAASLRAWEDLGRPSDAGVPCVLYAPDGLRLQSFHRRVTGPVDAAALIESLRRRTDVVETDGPRPAVGSVALYAAGRWFAVPLGALLGTGQRGVEALDVARLQADILDPLLGVGAVGDDRLEVAPATDPLTHLVASCDADGGVLFVLAAPSVAQLVEVADRHEVMLPKSTFFEPKPQAGIFLQLIEP
ncbi:MAG: DUF1015 family protein [Nocardioidaceae bacterium]